MRVKMIMVRYMSLIKLWLSRCRLIPIASGALYEKSDYNKSTNTYVTFFTKKSVDKIN